MLINFSKNPFKQVIGIAAYNWGRLVVFIVIACIAYGLDYMHEHYQWYLVQLPVVPVTILGGALAIFLGFRNQSAYDRWWEARKIWGGIVNYSRSWSTLVLSFSSSRFSDGDVTEEEVKAWQKQMVYRHIGWLHALNMHLRKKYDWEKLDDYISEEELALIKKRSNKPTQIINQQGLNLKVAHEKGIIENFRHMELASVLKEFYNLQGKAERIKNTVFPYYYNYFTRVFLWLFIGCLPFALVETMEWGAIPMSVAISFVFSILEKSGVVTEDPFEGRAADTPISTIVRGIEIDLRQMLGEQETPSPMEATKGRFGVTYLD